MGRIKDLVTKLEQTRQDGAAAIVRLGRKGDRDDAAVALEALAVIYAELLDLLPTVGDDDPHNDPPGAPTDIEEAIDTGHTLEVRLGDGTALRIPNVDEFNLIVDATREWPVGWQREEEEAEPRAGFWTSEGDWRPFDARYRPRGIASGW